MAVEDHGLEVLKKAGKDPVGTKVNYQLQVELKDSDGGSNPSVGIRDTVHGKPATYTSFGDLKVAQETIIGDFRFDRDSIVDEWDVTSVGQGRYEILDGETGIKLSVLAAGDSIKLLSKDNMFYQSGKGMLSKFSMIAGDSGLTGLKREWGLKDERTNNGTFFRVDGTTLSWVILNNGVETVAASSSWDTPFTFDEFGHTYYLSYGWLGVEDHYCYIDGLLKHANLFLGVTSSLSMGNPDLKAYFYLENDTNNDTRTMTLGCCSIVSEGGQTSKRLNQSPKETDLAVLNKSQIIGETSTGSGVYNSAQVNTLNELLSCSRINIEQFSELLSVYKNLEKQLRINNMHLSIMTGLNIEEKDL